MRIVRPDFPWYGPRGDRRAAWWVVVVVLVCVLGLVAGYGEAVLGALAAAVASAAVTEIVKASLQGRPRNV